MQVSASGTRPAGSSGLFGHSTIIRQNYYVIYLFGEQDKGELAYRSAHPLSVGLFFYVASLWLNQHHFSFHLAFCDLLNLHLLK